MCLYPRLIENKKYRSNNKNGGNIPPVKDQRVRFVPIGCQHCMECKKQRSMHWRTRLLEDIKTNTNGKFITLTFSNESIRQLNTCNIEKLDKQSKKVETIAISTIMGYDKDNAIATLAVRKFLERWRKTYKTSLRHWLVTEIGHKGTENIHLHGIIWTDEPLTTVEQIWGYGFMWKGYKKNGKYINYVNGSTVNYITKYVNKIDLQHKTFKSVILTTPGIGSNYTNTHNSTKNKFNGTNTQDTYRTTTGHTIGLPIYWKNKLYTEEEREELWLQKLDKNERWICGEKIDISQTEENYYKLLEHYRTKNQELGYVANNKYWKRKIYEEERRKIMHAARIKGANKININELQNAQQAE